MRVERTGGPEPHAAKDGRIAEATRAGHTSKHRSRRQHEPSTIPPHKMPPRYVWLFCLTVFNGCPIATRQSDKTPPLPPTRMPPRGGVYLSEARGTTLRHKRLTFRIRHPLIAVTVGAHRAFEDYTNAVALVEDTLGAGSSQVGLGLIMHLFATALAKRILRLRTLDGSRNSGQR